MVSNCIGTPFTDDSPCFRLKPIHPVIDEKDRTALYHKTRGVYALNRIPPHLDIVNDRYLASIARCIGIFLLDDEIEELSVMDFVMCIWFALERRNALGKTLKNPVNGLERTNWAKVHIPESKIHWFTQLHVQLTWWDYFRMLARRGRKGVASDNEIIAKRKASDSFSELCLTLKKRALEEFHRFASIKKEDNCYLL